MSISRGGAEGLTENSSPGIFPSSQFPPINLQNGVGSHDGKRNTIPQLFVQFILFLVINVREGVDLYLLLRQFV